MKTGAGFLAAFGLVLAWAAWNSGGVTPAEWKQCLFALAALSALLWFTTSTRPPSWLAALPVALVLYSALQMVPLPPSLLGVLSPERQKIADGRTGIGMGQAWNPLSVSPALTFAHLLRLLAYLLVFLAVRELAMRLGERAWVASVPLLVIASLEAALGLAQRLAGAWRATGTYVNANHLAGLLEMSLPFAVVLAIRQRSIAGIACSLLLFAALLNTLSRTGLAAALVGLAALAALRSRSALLALAITATAAVVLFLVVPNQLLDRLAATTDVRFQIWKDTLGLIRAYPVFGCGLGAYVSAMQKYRVASAPLNLVDYAHSDYLQFLAEWGLAGFLPALAFVVLILRKARSGGWLGAACFSGLVALAVHSVADFNLYIPVNAMVAAWIAGISLSSQA